jgi:hypothetical protein
MQVHTRKCIQARGSYIGSSPLIQTNSLYVSVITFGEIRLGIVDLLVGAGPAGRRPNRPNTILELWDLVLYNIDLSGLAKGNA